MSPRFPRDPKSAEQSSGASLLDALVAGERAAMTPPPDAQQATWSRVAASVASAPLAAPGSAPAAAASATASWVKIVLGLVVGSVLAVTAYRAVSTPEDSAEVEVAATPGTPRNEPSDRPPEVHPPAAVSAPALAPEVRPPSSERPTPSEAPAPNVPATPNVPARSGAKSRSAADPPPDLAPTSDLAEETRLLARARGRLRGGSASAALAPLAEHARRFPNGQLAEDRMVLRARALCKSGDKAAGRDEADALRKAFPASSHLPRVDRACR